MRHDRFDFARDLASLLYGKSGKELREKNPQGGAKVRRMYREELRKVQSDDRLRLGLRDGVVRVRYDEDGEGSTEYGILKGSYTPHEIQELVDENWMTIRSPYDCTGRTFTVDIHARQTPAGLVFIHRMGLDV